MIQFIFNKRLSLSCSNKFACANDYVDILQILLSAPKNYSFSMERLYRNLHVLTTTIDVDDHECDGGYCNNGLKTGDSSVSQLFNRSF